MGSFTIDKKSELVGISLVKVDLLRLNLDNIINGLKLDSEVRSKMTAASHYIVREHHKAIIMLIQHRLDTAAFALVRAIFEAHVRGIWLGRCASEKQIEDYKNDNSPKINTMIKCIENLDGYDGGTLSDVQKRSQRAMNSYAHAGFQHSVRLMTEDSVEPNYDPDEVVDVLRFTSALACLSALDLCRLANKEEYMAAILGELQSALGSPPASKE